MHIEIPWLRRRPPLQDRVARALEQGGIPVDELLISTDGRRVILRGPVASEQMRERAVELARAVPGTGEVDDRLTVLPKVEDRSEAPAKQERQSMYIVQPGDTLRDIALRLYGDENRWLQLLRLNERVVSEPRVLQPGLRLRLPRD